MTLSRTLVAAFFLCACARDPDDLAYQLPPAGPRCSAQEDTITCAHVTVTIHTGALGTGRAVHLMLPDGVAPDAGWPAAILFTGSLHTAEGMWSARQGDEFGGFHQTELVRALLQNGYAVFTPDSHLGGTTYWDTNVYPFSDNWQLSDDSELVSKLIDAIGNGSLGPLDGSRLYAAGISSGGYMTSRMAVSYAGRFRALAIESASYATCSGPICGVPTLPADHPATLFLHGEQDLIVPIATMRWYADALAAQQTDTRQVVDATAGHEWLAAAPDEIVAWFNRH